MKTALIVGGSRGLGRGAVESLKQTFEVHVLSRSPGGIVGDATDEALAERLVRELRPDLLLIVAGAEPVLGALHELTWDEFETNWRADARIAFVWLKQALRLPLQPGSHLIVVSSGAAVQGSPASGGYAAAKRAQWFMAQYAATEIERAGLGIRIHCLLPNLNPSTALGRHGIAEYARRAGISDEEFAKRFLPHVTPEVFGAAVAQLAESPAKWEQLAWRVTGAGLVAV